MKSMKSILFVLIASAQINVFAKSNPVRTFSVQDSKLGELVLKIEDVGEPVQQPLVMSMTVKCVDNRGKSNSVKPKTEKIDLGIVDQPDETPHDRICDFRTFNFDEKEKSLTIQYTKTAMKVGPGQCDTDYSRKFDLRALCAAWNR